MNAWDSIQNSLGWIEENLEENIEIKDLANMAHLSPFYYQRLFSRLTGKPVMEYVRLRRLAGAADYLAKNQVKIVDAAFKFGFENHETYTRAFKDTYGMTPEEYQTAPRPLSHFLMPQLSLKYHLVDENVPLIADGLVLEVRRDRVESLRLFVGLKIQNPIADTPGVDFLGELWNKFHKQKEAIEDLFPDGHEAGISYAGEEAGKFTYFAGAEVRKPGSQSGFISWAMPVGEYRVCSFDAENFYMLTTNALNKARDYMLQVWLPHHRLNIDPFMAELYRDTSPDATNMEIWLKIKSGNGL